MYTLEKEDAERLAEATAYINSYGRDGLRVIAEMYDRLQAGGILTDVMVERVLISKANEKRLGKAALKRQVARERAERRSTDLNHIYIEETVTDGSYAIRDGVDTVVLTVERPTQGLLAGFVTVKSEVAYGVEQWGIQYPQRREREYYRGRMAHLVARLVMNPYEARERYEQLEAVK
jgi:hypothetical protein